jgi:hypothetical protein
VAEAPKSAGAPAARGGARARFSAAQTSALSALLARTSHPSEAQRAALAAAQGLSKAQVDTWLKNKRKVGAEKAKRAEDDDTATALNKAALRAAFAAEPQPDAAARRALAAQLGMTAQHVSEWFRSKRQKEKAKQAAAR